MRLDGFDCWQCREERGGRVPCERGDGCPYGLDVVLTREQVEAVAVRGRRQVLGDIALGGVSGAVLDWLYTIEGMLDEIRDRDAQRE